MLARLYKIATHFFHASNKWEPWITILYTNQIGERKIFLDVDSKKKVFRSLSRLIYELFMRDSLSVIRAQVGETYTKDMQLELFK